MRLQEETCLPVPSVTISEDLGTILFSDRTPWYRYLKKSYEHLCRRHDGTFYLAVRGTMSPMDLVNAVRGDGVSEDFLLRPRFAHRVLRRMTEAVRWYYPRLLSWADEVASGHIVGGLAWMGQHCMGHLSSDAAILCSPQVYGKFGFPYERQLVAG